MREIKKSTKLDNVLYDVRGPVVEEAERMEEAGARILKLNIGNPAPFDFRAPEEMVFDMSRQLAECEGYSSAKGLFSARKAIMQYAQLKHIQGVDIDDVYTGNGVSELINLSMLALLDNGDEVLVPSPDYPLWTACVTLAGGTPVHYVCAEQAEWYPDMDAIRKKMIVFGIGPAGTGKTYLAMAMAIQAFKNGEVGRIILTRPAIEAGEKLGFLPGDLQSKIDPYLRPLYDALYQIMGAESYLHNSEKGLIEVAPLAYMRGRTLDNAYIILDEAQNTTPAQMKMFLTRIGFGSKVIVTGDQTQKDLPSGATTGLDTAIKVLRRIDDIGFCYLTSSDVVRHPLVQKIVQAYDDFEQKGKATPHARRTRERDRS